jgi:hypothetical protein
MCQEPMAAGFSKGAVWAYLGRYLLPSPYSRVILIGDDQCHTLESKSDSGQTFKMLLERFLIKGLHKGLNL